MKYDGAKVKPKKEKNFGVTDDMIIRALEKTGGNYTEAAAILDLSRQTVYWRTHKNKRIRIIREDIRMDLVNLAESVVEDHVMRGDLKAAMFVLERRSRDKWSNRVQVQAEEWPEPIGEKPPGMEQ